jgi:hypothetical protein
VDPKTEKGLGAQIVIWTFYDQVVKVGEWWVEQELVLLIIAELPNCQMSKYPTVFRSLNVYYVTAITFSLSQTI